MPAGFLSIGVFLCLTMWITSAMAIVNAGSAQFGEVEEGWSGSVDIGLDGTSGNTDKFGFRAGGRVHWHRQSHSDLALVSFRYGKSRGRADANKSFAHVRHMQHISPLTTLEGFGQAEKNEFSRLSFRGLIGIGVRRALLADAERGTVYLGLGGMYEDEELQPRTGATDALQSQLWRANLYLILTRRFNEQMRVVSSTYYQPRLNDWGDARLLEQAALLIKLSKVLDLKLSLEVQHDSRPPQQVEKTDISYSTGLELHF
jgi:putative salt-induced outer membrane protein YdiY